MSTAFSQAATLPASRQARPAATLHQSNSWREFASPWRVIQLWAQRRAQRHALLELADQKHLLEDIGVTRAEVVREAAKPFWQV
jgi:uncharacterized protein YjiS (DUF1127 family)